MNSSWKKVSDNHKLFLYCIPRMSRIAQCLIWCDLCNYRGYFSHLTRKLSKVLVFLFIHFFSFSSKKKDSIAKVSYPRNYTLGVTRYASWRQSNGLKLIFTLAQHGLQPRNVTVVSLIDNIIIYFLRPRNDPDSGTNRSSCRSNGHHDFFLIAGTMTKLNSVPVSLKNRPRIPTPDVTKEVIDREQRLALSATNAANIGAGVVGVIPANGHYPDLSVVVLSPIQETESTPSSGKSGAAALAQAVLSPTLTSAGLMTPVTLTPVTMGHLTQLGLMTTATTTTPHINQGNSIQATLTEVTSSEEEGSGSGSSRSGSITGQEDRSTPLIDNNNSPMGSNGSSPIFDGYNDRSPILMRPEKLGYVVTAAVPGILANRAMAIDARGRRSASLPSPPVPLAQPGRDDRSVSLPQSPGLQPREIRMTSVSSKQDDLTVERSATVSSNQGIRSRTSSFGHDLSKSNQRVQDATRKISSASNASGSLGTTSSTSSTSVTMTVANSKRDEVYVWCRKSLTWTFLAQLISGYSITSCERSLRFIFFLVPYCDALYMTDLFIPRSLRFLLARLLVVEFPQTYLVFIYRPFQITRYSAKYR